MVFKLLEKNHLKSVRVACKLLALLVSPLLFDKIYISPHKKNMDVFRQITEHSDLCQYPRKLVYDVQEFNLNIGPTQYYFQLGHQISLLFKHCLQYDMHHHDTGIEDFMYMFNEESSGDEFDSTCRNIHFVQRGLGIYREKAEEQDHYNKSGLLLACLCIGLMKLPYLDQVNFQSKWDDLHLQSVNWSKNPRNLRIFSSPLARSWSPFHLMPRAAFFGTTAHQFDNVISAFSLARRPLRVLEAGNLTCVPYEKLNTDSCLSRIFRQHSTAATYGLERLTLRVSMRHYSAEECFLTLHDVPPEDNHDVKPLSVDLLATALRHMPRLRYLSLSGGKSVDECDPMMLISELFQDVRLPDLEFLTLSGMLGSAADILAFIRAQPQLRNLHLAGIELSEGTWAGLVDDMQKWLHLESMGLQTPLRQGGGVDLWAGFSWKHSNMSDKIEKYVLHGGKNPLWEEE